MFRCFIRHPQGGVPEFLMLAGSMFYIHCCIPLQWYGTTHLIVRNIALFSGVALCTKVLR
jgi:hypothetical protein